MIPNIMQDMQPMGMMKHLLNLLPIGTSTGHGFNGSKRC